MKKLFFLFILVPVVGMGQFKVPEKFSGSDVHDYDKVLSAEQVVKLNKKLSDFRKVSPAEFAIVILSDLQDYEPQEVAQAIGNTWGVGKKEVDNGVVYLIAPKHRKGHIAVGSGIEGDLTDIETKQIQVNARQFYKQGLYYDGINQVIDEFIRKLDPVAKEQRLKIKAEQEKASKEFWTDVWIWAGYITLSGLVLFLIIYVRRRNKKAIEEEERLRKEEQKRLLKEQADKAYERQKRESDLKRFLTSKLTFPVTVKSVYRSIQSRSQTFLDYGVDIDTLLKNIKILDASTKTLLKLPESEVTSLIVKTVIDNERKVKDYLQSAEYNVRANIEKEEFVKTAFKDLDMLRDKAQQNLKNTPFKDLKNDLFKEVMKQKPSYLLHLSVLTLVTLYNDVIFYQQNERRVAQERAETLRKQKEAEQREEQMKRDEERRKKQREEDEERDKRRRSEDCYSSSSLSSCSSSSFSSSSFDSGSYGGGSFSGGGSSDSW